MNIQKIDITPAMRQKWIETRSALLWTAPAFTHLLFSMLNPTKGELAATFTTDVPVAATDGTNLILNPETFFKRPLAQRVFITAHEIVHCMWNHCALSYQFRQSGKVKYADGTELPYDAMLMNKAMDLVINDMLIECKIGEFPPDGMHDPKLVTHKDSFLDAYRKVYKQKPGGGGKGNKPGNQPGKQPGGSGGSGTSPGNQPGDGGGFDVLLDPGTVQGKNADTAVQERNDTAWKTAVASALAAAKAQGKLPATLERMFREIIEPEVQWQDLIRAFFARKVGAGSYDWRKPDRRLIQRDIYAPQRSGSGCGDVVVAVDTSGSIAQRELDVFFAEMRGILEDVRPNRVHLVWCDAKVHHVDEVDQASDLKGLKPYGGGGTDFRPVFTWVEDNNIRPDALVYLTDGLGYFPDQAPSYPLIWGSIYEQATYPFGEVVEIPFKKKA